MAFGFMKKISPEYVVKKAVEDIRVSGIEGIKPYLTDEALKKVDSLMVLSDGIDLFTVGMSLMTQSGSKTAGSNPVAALKHPSKYEWTVKDVIKGSSAARGIVKFKGQDNEGTIEFTLVKDDDDEWKINDIDLPGFDLISMAQGAKG